ncbi:hypothetical protein HELRODRAFT_194322 [Helobdella robusta]|uniref:WD repeat and FYVE domain-containing protein 3 n=1 Tax=Helobdella robusta TaxID=6412 RepID=T1FVX6_HELRO|nr:hypothetical protein HELRODRAFT_194322 [Helobdella robusta]ESN92294.1 hypothetical protein HELRODRAFT_194322 [Helobdella robusta]
MPSELLDNLNKSKLKSELDLAETIDDDVNEIDADVTTAPITSSSTSSSAEVDSKGKSQFNEQAIYRLLEEGETITNMFRCARIQGLDTMEGLLLFAREHFYIVDGYTLITSKDITDIVAIDGLPPEFLTLGTSLTDSAQESVSGQRLNAKVEQRLNFKCVLCWNHRISDGGERGEISNFEYLMCLNTLAGRSYNDLMQYPVFPWIVADYDSEELDFTNPFTFRDLANPMGAQTADRLKQFKKRFSDWDDPHGETPPYHYGTHYSSAMIVASYLGGHFDLADRMFHSIKDAWLSASRHNMADVKELIPEFFYLPDFLLNSNNFDLGAKQNGVLLGDVILPPWSKGDPREFIRVHREALESNYVSAKLHEWIDLIFGYKQQGAAAVDAVNVFHHLFYEGNVNIYDIDDPLKKNAIIGFINNFGQIPKQLFKKPHPCKKLSLRTMPVFTSYYSISYSVSEKLFFHYLDNLSPSLQPIKELKGAVGQIVANDKSLLAVEQNKTLIPFSYSKYLAWGHPDMSVRIGNYDSEKALLVVENVDMGDILCSACPNDKTLLTAGTSTFFATVGNVHNSISKFIRLKMIFFEEMCKLQHRKFDSVSVMLRTVVKVWRLNLRKDGGSRLPTLQLRKCLFGHTEAVTCLTVSSAYNIIISGSRDRTCIVWDLNKLCFVRQLRGHAAPVAAIYINDITGDIATCSGTYLHMWTVNGQELANINTATSRNQQILCVTMSQMKEWDANNVIITGNSDGVVRMWSLEFIEVKDGKRNAEVSENKSAEDERTTAWNTKEQQQQQPPGQQRLDKKRLHEEDGPSRRGSLLKDWLEKSAEKKKNWGEDDYEVEVGSGISGRSEWDPIFNKDKIIRKERSFTPSPLSAEALRAVRPLSGCDGNQSADSMELPASADTSLDSANKERDTSSSSSYSKEFCIITDEEIKEIPQHLSAPQKLQKSPVQKKIGLREGFKWQRQLVFRSKLTMHTAFERKDNRDPAAITALSISRDHKTLYVGDAKGHIYSWSVMDQPGRAVADHWVKDDGGDSCQECSVKFTFSERRHHCRNCGQLFCSKCSRFEIDIKHLKTTKPARVCQHCYSLLRTQQSTDTD